MPPDGALVAKFKSVSISIGLSKLTKPTKNKKRKQNKAEPLKIHYQTRSQSRKAFEDLDKVGEIDSTYGCLALADQTAVDEFIKDFNLAAGHGQSTRKRKFDNTKRSYEEVFASKSTQQLFCLMLKHIVVGLARYPRNITASGHNSQPCLLELAPGVFNLPYLQVNNM